MIETDGAKPKIEIKGAMFWLMIFLWSAFWFLLGALVF